MLSVSTKTGDKGKSSLANGTRLSKAQPVFEVIGTIDELNAHLGWVVTAFRRQKNKKLLAQQKFLLTIQEELFTMGGEMAGAGSRVTADFLKELEQVSLDLQQTMADGWHSRFLLPGGHELAARLDLARTVCRRLERRLVALSEKQPVRPVVLQTTNRLADYLYVLRCFVNERLKQKEIFV